MQLFIHFIFELILLQKRPAPGADFFEPQHKSLPYAV
jgi:hypothetical protein